MLNVTQIYLQLEDAFFEAEGLPLLLATGDKFLSGRMTPPFYQQ